MRKLTALLPLLWLCACSSLKHVTTTATAVHDTVKITVQDTSAQVQTMVQYKTVHDTVIHIAGGTVTTTYAGSQLLAGTYHNGYKVPQTYSAANGSVHSTVTVDTSGHITVTCQADSLRLVVANLVTINTQLTDSIRLINRSTTAKTVDTSYSYKDVWHKTTSFFHSYWWILLIVAIVFIIVECFRGAHRAESKNPLL